MADCESRATKVLDEIDMLLRRGNTIAAIKVYRTAIGVGLNEARNAFESARTADGAVEVGRATSTGVFGGVLRAPSRWRGQTD